jgi:putative inorganic carbon (HCO3(-)) transporter
LTVSSAEKTVAKKYDIPVEKLILYGLIAILLAMTLPWELMPYPFSQISVIDTGAGEFLETRLFAYTGTSILLFIWVFSSYLRGRLRWQRSSLDIPLMFFLFIGLISIFGFRDLHASLDGFLMIFSYILFFYLILNNTRSLADIKSYTLALVLSGSLIALYSIYQYLVGFELLNRYIASKSLGTAVPNRVFAIFVSPNHLAGFLIMIIPLAFVTLTLSRSNWQKLIFGAALVAMGIGIVMTQSRGGWLSLGLVLLVLLSGYIMLKKPKEIFVLITVLAFTITIGSVLMMPGKRSAPQATSYSALESSEAVLSAQGRFLLWRGSMRMAQAYPLSGTGIGTFATMYPLFQYGGLYSKHAHNVYLEILAETGIFGFLLIIIIFFLIIIKGVAIVRRKDDSYSLLALGLLAGVVGFTAHSLIDFEWYMVSAGLVFWFLAGSIFVCDRLCGEASGALSRSVDMEIKRPVVRLLAAIIIMSILVEILVLFSATAALFFFGDAKMLYQQQQIDSAIGSLKKATQLDPLDASYQSRLGQLYLLKANSESSSEMKKLFFSQAAISGKEAIKLRPYWAEYHAQLGSVYSYSGNRFDALRQFRKSEVLYPKKPHYKVLIGEFYLAGNDYGKAEHEFKRALSLQRYYTVWYPGFVNQDFERAHVGLGEVYVKQKRFAQAEEHFEKALELNPQSKSAIDQLRKIRNRRRK